MGSMKSVKVSEGVGQKVVGFTKNVLPTSAGFYTFHRSQCQNTLTIFQVLTKFCSTNTKQRTVALPFYQGKKKN